jgi:uncharacterized protein (TIGR02284 family)
VRRPPLSVTCSAGDGFVFGTAAARCDLRSKQVPHSCAFAMNEESILSTVENLILVCEEAADGYLHASRKVSDSTLKLLLESYSFQRHTFADRLQGAVPEASPNRAEVLQQQDDHGWSTLIGNKDPMDEASVLAACEWAEESSLSAYREALEQQSIPDRLKELISSQFTEIVAAQNWVGDTHDSLVQTPPATVF